MLLLLSPAVAMGQVQNLVPNGSFEEFYECPNNYTVDYTKKFLPGWSMPTKGTPDYFNRCSRAMVGVPQNFMGSIFPQHGDGFVGIVLTDTPFASKDDSFSDYIETSSAVPVNLTNLKDPLDEKKVNPINYREYIQAQLKLPLQCDQLYKVSFYYAVANSSTFIINRLGVHLGPNRLTQKAGVIDVVPQLSINPLVVPSSPGLWVHFADTFRAKGGETYITVGNFYDDLNIKVIENDLSSLNTDLQRTVLTNQLAYIYLDNFSVERVQTVGPDTLNPKFIPYSQLPVENLSELSKPQVFGLLDEVYFDPGNIYSPPMSLKQINTLVGYLIDRPDVRIAVYGLRYEFDIDDEGVRNRVDKFSELLQGYGIADTRIVIKYLDMKAMPIITKISTYGVPFDLYGGLIAISFF